MSRPPAIETETALWLALDVSSLRLTDDQLLRLFRDNEGFQFELPAKSDRLGRLKEKMEEYIANGVRLGWLLDPQQNWAAIYRPGRAPQEIEKPTILSGDPILPGFRFDFRAIL